MSEPWPANIRKDWVVHKGCPNCEGWQEAHDLKVAEVERLRQALIPFAFIGRGSMMRLGLAEEYDIARDLLGLE